MRRLSGLSASLSGPAGRRLLVSFGGSGVVQGLGVVTGILLARGLGPSDRGVFAAMLLWPTVMISLGDLGLVNSFGYFSARSTAPPSAMNRLARRAAGLQSLYLLPLTILVAAIGLSAIDAQPLAAGLVLAAAFVPAALFSRFTSAVFQGHREMHAFYAVRLSMYVVIAIGLLVAIVTDELTVWTTVLIYLAGLGFMTIVSFALPRAVARRRPTPPESSGAGEFDRRTFLSFGLRSLPGSLYPVETLYLDQVFVALFIGTSDLGIYVSALAFTSLIRLVAAAIATNAMPSLAQAETAHRRVLTLRWLGVGVAALAPVTAALILVMPTLLPFFFGDAFKDGVGPARFLLLGSLAFGLRQIVGEALRGSGRPGIVSIVEVATWPLILGAAAIGTIYGLEGVTIGLLCVQVTGLFALSIAGFAPTHGFRRARRHRMMLAYLLVPVLVVAAGVGAGEHEHIQRAALLVLLAIIAPAPLIIRGLQKRFDPFEPITLLSLAFIVLFVVRPLVQIGYDQFTFRDLAFGAGFDQALLVALTGITALYTGYELRAGRWLAGSLPTPRNIWRPSTAAAGAGLISLVGLGLFALFLYRGGGLTFAKDYLSGRTQEQSAIVQNSSAYLYYGPYMLLPAALIALEARARKREFGFLLLAGLCLLLVIAVTGPRGDRILLLSMLLSVATLPFLRSGRRPKFRSLMLAFVMVFLIGVSFLGNVRTTVTRDLSPFQTFVATVKDPVESVKTFLLGADSEMFPVMAIQMQHLDKHNAGITIESLVSTPVPGVLWEGKPASADSEIYQELFPFQASITRAGPSPSMFGGFWYDAGWIGVILGALIVGTLARTLYEYFLARPENAGVRMIYAAALPLTFLMPRSNPTDALPRSVFLIVPVILCVWAASRRLGWAPVVHNRRLGET